MGYSLKPQEPIALQLFEELRKAIVEMRMQPGEALSEKELSVRYGVSRQPVREAFIKLSEAGLLEIRPSRGTYVRKISMREIADARFVREAIECSLTHYAAKLARPEDCAILRALIAEQEKAAETKDFVRFNQSDQAFHKTIGDIVQCDYALKAVERARNQIDRARFLSLGSATPMKRLVQQHKDIVTSMENGNADAAEHAMRLHLREILLALPSLANAHPSVFEDHDMPDHTVRILQTDHFQERDQKQERDV